MPATFTEVSPNTTHVLHPFLLKYLMYRCLLLSNLKYYNLKNRNLIPESLYTKDVYPLLNFSFSMFKVDTGGNRNVWLLNALVSCIITSLT